MNTKFYQIEGAVLNIKNNGKVNVADRLYFFQRPFRSVDEADRWLLNTYPDLYLGARIVEVDEFGHKVKNGEFREISYYKGFVDEAYRILKNRIKDRVIDVLDIKDEVDEMLFRTAVCCA